MENWRVSQWKRYVVILFIVEIKLTKIFWTCQIKGMWEIRLGSILSFPLMASSTESVLTPYILSNQCALMAEAFDLSKGTKWLLSPQVGQRARGRSPLGCLDSLADGVLVWEVESSRRDPFLNQESILKEDSLHKLSFVSPELPIERRSSWITLLIEFEKKRSLVFVGCLQ